MTNTTDIFLSHNWGNDELGRNNHERVSLIKKALDKLGYCTWLDDEKLRGDIIEKITKGIEQTKCVIVFMTQKYYDKVNGDDPKDYCKLEFRHARNLKTRNKMVAVIMEPRMKGRVWTGQVGLCLNGKMFIDMSDDVKEENYLMKKIQDLEKELGTMGIKPTGVIKCNVTNKEPNSGTLDSSFLFCFSIL